jgi:hypothetical protein
LIQIPGLGRRNGRSPGHGPLKDPKALLEAHGASFL